MAASGESDPIIPLCSNSYMHKNESLVTPHGLAELFASTESMSLMFPILLPTVICICAEQTFSQASTYGADFSVAFSKALDAYVSSTLNDSVKNAIAKLPRQDFQEVENPGAPSYQQYKKVVAPLAEIVKTHRLRTLFIVLVCQNLTPSRHSRP